ncbi:hypothetical protein ACHAXA_009647 [Cyclostephanos tholiformis]|uniref:ATP-dependent (S)-NAD(P)H-hydrate dehydratase n=1 Tax=Cyclostephanos tholiformis TaxID=382380 RepID=A0ABD3SE24_9STRA
MYAGAPYYAAESALRCGVDLVTVYTAAEACMPIKCYSPELMVRAVYSIEVMNSYLDEEGGIIREMEGECRRGGGGGGGGGGNDAPTTKETNGSDTRRIAMMSGRPPIGGEGGRYLPIQGGEARNDDGVEVLAEGLGRMTSLEGKLHALGERREVFIGGIVDDITHAFPTLHAMCIGPGLGRHPLVFSVAEKVIQRAIEARLMLIIDADALFMLSLGEYRDLLEDLRSYERCVMTPNLMEMRRLRDALSADDGGGRRSNIIVQKGNVDEIIHDSYTMRCEEEGGLKRCGGIGDVLAGTISAFMAWNAILEMEETHDAQNDVITNKESEWQRRLFASWAAAVVVKKATKVAFQKKKRSMSALDVIGEIGDVVNDMEDDLKNAVP